MRIALCRFLTLLSAGLAGPALGSDGETPCVLGRMAPQGGLSSIALEPHGFPAALREVPEVAARMWNAGECNSGGFPRFTLDGDGDRRLRVRWIDGVSPAAGVCGRFVRDEIELYAAAIPPSGSQPIRCGERERLAETLAHELGHALGLLDVHGAACAGRIMGQLLLRHDGTLAPRAVHAEECAVADRRFVTLAERIAPRFSETWETERTTISRFDPARHGSAASELALLRPPPEL
jgi:hypothetical protein